MACFYVYESGSLSKPLDPTYLKELVESNTLSQVDSQGQRIISDSVENIYKQLSFQTKNIATNNVDLIFYDKETETPQQTYQFFVDLKNKNTATSLEGDSVTTIISNLFKATGKQKEYQNVQSGSKEEDFIFSFQTKFGEILHECVQYYNTEKQYETYQKLIDFLNTYRKQLNSDTKLQEKLGNFQKSVFNILSRKNDLSIDEIDNVVSAISRYFNGKYVVFEVPVGTNSALGKIQGRIDALVIDANTGDIEIIDFKTSASTRSSKNIEKLHYAQLFLYKNILAQEYGIPLHRISFKNAHINYSTGKLVAGKYEGGQIYTDFSESGISAKADYNQFLRPYFPRVVDAMSPQEREEALEKVRKVKSSIFSSEFMRRDEPDVFAEYLKAYDKDTPFYSQFLQRRFTISFEGNDIILTDVEDKTREVLNIDQFIQNELDARHNKLVEIADSFKTAIKGRNIQNLEALIPRSQAALAITSHLGQYMDSDWEVVDNDVFLDLGIIVMYNNASDSYDFINIVPYVKFETTYKFELNKEETMNILGNCVSKEMLKNYPGANVAARVDDILTLQTLIAIGELSPLLKKNGNSLKVGQIVSISSTSGYGTFRVNLNPILNQFKILDHINKNNSGLLEFGDLYSEINQQLLQIQFDSPEEIAYRKVLSAMRNFNPNSRGVVTPEYINQLTGSATLELNNKIAALEKLREQFRLDNSIDLQQNQYADRSRNEISRVLMWLDSYIATLKGLATDEAYITSSMGVDYNNSLRAGWQMLTQREVNKFSNDGVLINGLLQGMSTATPYANPDDTVRMISQLHTYGTTKVQLEVQGIIDEMNKATTKWLEGKETRLQTLFISNHKDLYRQLFQTVNGELDPEFKFKNPFTDNSLTADDKEYLKVCLWSILRVKDSGLSSDLKKLSYAELSKDKSKLKQFEEFLKNNESALNVPLKTAKSTTSFFNSIKAISNGNWKQAGEIWKRKLEKAKYWVDPRGLTETQLNEKKAQMEALQAYNIYTELPSVRKSRLAATGIENFEWNLNWLINDHAFTYVTVKVNQEILNSTSEIIAHLQLIQNLTGRDLSGQINEIKARTNISMFNSNNVDSEFSDLTNVVGYLRTVLNFGKIAFRPILMGKELITGRTKNLLYSSLGYFDNDGISLKSMLQGEKIVFGEGVVTGKWNRLTGKMKAGDRTKVEAINWLYRVANMDANIIAQKTLADRFGLLNTGLDIMYYTNTRPDWYNRLSVFVAKMIEDGCWEAHYLDDQNRLIYDISKDHRYNVYWNNQDKEPKPGDSNYKIFQEQKARYNWAIQSFIKNEFKNADGTLIKEGDPLPIAYTVEETNSIKEIVGMLYGYYNHEERTSFQTGSWSQLFLSFKTYLAGELKHYFALPNSKTSIGRVEHVKDATGQLLYKKIDEATGVEFITTEDTGIPYYNWTGHPIEGLITSTFMCGIDLFTKEGREDLKYNVRRRRNMEAFLLRMLIASLFGSIIAMLIKGSNKETDKSTKIALNMLKKSGQDLSFYHSVLEPFDDLGIVGVDYLEQTFKNTITSITNADEELSGLIYKNLSMAKDIVNP